MAGKITCPICANQAKWEYYSSPWGLEEEKIDCPHCGYYYQFAYGNYLEAIKGKEYIWHHTTKYTNPIHKRIKRDVFMARRNWKKLRKNLQQKPLKYFQFSLDTQLNLWYDKPTKANCTIGFNYKEESSWRCLIMA